MKERQIILLGSLAALTMFGFFVWKCFIKKPSTMDFDLSEAGPGMLQQPSQQTPFVAPEPPRTDVGADQPWTSTDWEDIPSAEGVTGMVDGDDPLDVEFTNNTAYIQ